MSNWLTRILFLVPDFSAGHMTCDQSDPLKSLIKHAHFMCTKCLEELYHRSLVDLDLTAVSLLDLLQWVSNRKTSGIYLI